MNMDTERTNSQMRKGILEYCILLIIEKNEVYVPDIIEKLKASNLIVVEGTLYPLVMRLKNSGYLSYQWKESTSGPPRKYYSITEAGKNLLADLDTMWTELSNTIESLKNNQTS